MTIPNAHYFFWDFSFCWAFHYWLFCLLQFEVVVLVIRGPENMGTMLSDIAYTENTDFCNTIAVNKYICSKSS